MMLLEMKSCKFDIIVFTSSHCMAVVSLWAMKMEVLFVARDFSALNISASVVLSSALVASSQSLIYSGMRGLKS